MTSPSVASALNGRDSPTREVVRLSRSCVGEEEAAAIAKVIAAGFLGMGSEVQCFEEELRNYLDSDLEVVCVNTGTAALHLALEGMDIGTNCEVLVPSITYVASFQAISAAGALPVACDVTANRIFIDLDDAARRLTDRTKAIMPVHYASDSTGMREVYAFARRYGLRVIEDAAHAFGGSRDGHMIGAEGDVICFSFDGIKNITSGEGGAVVTSDPVLAQRIRDGRLLGVEKDTEMRYSGQRSWTFDVHRQGYRYHMSNIMAAIGRQQLKKLPAFAARRREIVERYISVFSNSTGIGLLDLNWNAIVPHIFVIRTIAGKRDRIADALRQQHIESGFHYQPNHLLELYRTSYRLPMAETLADEILSLPLHPMLTDEQVARVISTVISVVED